jgi:hypothetical protein
MDELERLTARVIALNSVVTHLLRLVDRQTVVDWRNDLRIEEQDFRAGRTDYDGPLPDLFLESLARQREILDTALGE